jgi:hypothetical protein
MCPYPGGELRFPVSRCTPPSLLVFVFVTAVVFVAVLPLVLPLMFSKKEDDVM